MTSPLFKTATIEFVVSCSVCHAGLHATVEVTQMHDWHDVEDYLSVVVDPCGACVERGYYRGRNDELRDSLARVGTPDADDELLGAVLRARLQRK